MPGYIEFFGLNDWYDGLLHSEQVELQNSVRGLLTETYPGNLKGHPGIYSTLSTNIDAPPGVFKQMKFSVCNMHIRADLLEKNINNRALLNPLRYGNHGFEEREFKYYKCAAAKSLATFYFWNRQLLGEKKITTYAEMAIELFSDYVEHIRFLRIRDLYSLVSTYEKYYEDAFVHRKKTPQSDPRLYEELTTNIAKYKAAIYEIENSCQFIKDKFFWNYARFLAIRKRYDEAAVVIMRAIDLHIHYAGHYLHFLVKIKERQNFGKKDFWAIL